MPCPSFPRPALAPPPEPQPGSDADRAAIEAVLAQEAQAWGRGDAERFAPVTDGVVFCNLLGMSGAGRDAFVAHHARIFATNYKGSTMTQEVKRLAFVRPDVVVADSVAQVRGYQGLPPNVTPIDGAMHLHLSQVMVREEGAWRVASFHNVAVHPAAMGAPPAAPAPSAAPGH